ncbi:hypothetical protein LOTGIDRAFT_236429 [Lottia gigantea]|uniref:EF-hand domain-containing protein n=1 Tax=Lottia gigantea TaxID=225164 RepID=V3ZS92_LOTGI|nr:hypothetical protein LOTGIDRAFT_236429 [Lottia gigantea]ESO83766.1 hypothetical protein LOTGIDRAFT_236429 [Lottia gigantea]
MMKLLVVVLLVVVAVYAQDTAAPTHQTKHPHTKHPHTQHPHTQHAHTHPPHTTHHNGGHNMIKTSFTLVDTDKDGMLSLKEMDAAFLSADTDKDGHLSMAEYQAVHSTENPALVQAMYKYFDVNDNGKLDKSDVKIAFHHFDVDSDSHVSLHEFTVEYTAIHKLLVQASHHTSKPIIG